MEPFLVLTLCFASLGKVWKRWALGRGRPVFWLVGCWYYLVQAAAKCCAGFWPRRGRVRDGQFYYSVYRAEEQRASTEDIELTSSRYSTRRQRTSTALRKVTGYVVVVNRERGRTLKRVEASGALC